MSDRDRRRLIADTTAARDAAQGKDNQAYAAMNRQLIDLLREDHTAKQEKKAARPTLTLEQQHAALVEQLATAPASVHWEVHQRILALHPEWAEADNEPGGELIPIKGGKR
jgi:S-adenosylhomocysteine hydrolase